MNAIFFKTVLIALATFSHLFAQTEINPAGRTVQERFAPPSGYERVACDSKSFGTYLRKHPVLEDTARVRYYTGRVNPHASPAAVIATPRVFASSEHFQCADAVFYLYASFLKQQKREIVFRSWAGNPVRYKSQSSFSDYVLNVFKTCNTASMENDVRFIGSIDSLKAGDVFLTPGNPGHVMIVMDVAANRQTNDLCFLLAESYMPAQSLQVVKNRNGGLSEVWYSVRETKDAGTLATPRWKYASPSAKLARFKN